MANTTVNYDGYEFDLNQFPWNQPISGAGIKQEIRKKSGESPEGSMARITPDGRYEHIGAEEPVQFKEGDRIAAVPSFETADGGV